MSTLSSLTGAVGGFDCVHIMHPELSGASAVIAAGSRDSNIYLWRRRPCPEGGAKEGGRRRMREFTHTDLIGHKVRGSEPLLGIGYLTHLPLPCPQGWVWSLASDPTYPHLCSGSWDATIKVWDVCVAQEVAHIRYRASGSRVPLLLTRPSLSQQEAQCSRAVAARAPARHPCVWLLG